MTQREPGAAAARATRPVEWLIAIAGGLALAALLVWSLRGGEAAPDEAPASAGAPTPAIAPAIAPAIVPPAPTPAPAAPPPPDFSAIKLRGIVNRPSGASAMVEIAGGGQRLVRTGSITAHGVQVTAIAADHIAVTSGGTTQILRFDDAPAGPAVAAAATAPANPATDPRIAALAATSSDWRIGLTAERRDGRVIGFTVVDSARLPLLRRAGLQPGDIITAINGSALSSEEKVIELPAEIAGAYAVELSYVRDGSARTAKVPVNR